jgi:hypothetical protein
VAVREALSLRDLERQRDAVDDAGHLRGRERAAAREQLAQRRSGDPLHDDERALGGRAVIDDLHDRVVVKRGGEVRAATERARVDGAQHLEREAPRHSLVSRLVHAATGDERADEAIAPCRDRPRKISHPRHAGAS